MLSPLEPLATSSVGYGLAIALGLLWGSFANVCIYRWPSGRSVIAPSSHCAACQAPIRWYDNVPVLAWLWLGGRCRACKAPISPRYLVVEATTGALFGVAWWAAVVAPTMFDAFDRRLLHFVIYAAFCLVMVVIAFIDLDHKLILHKITIPSIAGFYLASFAWPERRWYDGLVGMAIGYGLPWAIGEIYYRITRRDGLGLGDGMLLALIGALLGWRGVLVALFGGATIGTVIVLTAMLVAGGLGALDEPGAIGEPGEPGEPGAALAEAASEISPDPAGTGPEEEKPSLMRTEVPFGPFLAMAAVLYLFAEPWFHIDVGFWWFRIDFLLPGG